MRGRIALANSVAPGVVAPTSVQLGVTPFAVVDVETTGFSPRLHDRMIEVAVVRMAANGTIEDEYLTLLNPQRDIGATQVHGLTAADVCQAPTFVEVVGDVATRLDGAILVGHNLRFDLAFLIAECARAGYPLPAIPGLCTLRLAYLLAPGLASRKLASCCASAGIRLDGAHSALADARATARLLLAYLQDGRARGLDSLEAFGCQPLSLPSRPWCQATASGRCLRREQAATIRQERTTYLARLVDRLDTTGVVSAEVAVYLDLLDRALEDRRITELEADALLAIAQEWGLSRQQVTDVHRQYLRALAQAAWADGEISSAERRDLQAVCALLGVQPPVLASLLAGPMPAPTDHPAAPQQQPTASQLAGQTVCFTGALSGQLDGQPITRDQAEQLAAAAGLTVAPRVTKTLDLLVLADPDSLSSKARKARQYGTRIMAEAVFWQTIGISVQ
jgi:DNA polymerase III subunit epsilon